MVPGETIRHNLLFNACRETGGNGPFNSWDRQRFRTERAFFFQTSPAHADGVPPRDPAVDLKLHNDASRRDPFRCHSPTRSSPRRSPSACAETLLKIDPISGGCAQRGAVVHPGVLGDLLEPHPIFLAAFRRHADGDRRGAGIESEGGVRKGPR